MGKHRVRTLIGAVSCFRYAADYCSRIVRCWIDAYRCKCRCGLLTLAWCVPDRCWCGWQATHFRETLFVRKKTVGKNHLPPPAHNYSRWMYSSLHRMDRHDDTKHGGFRMDTRRVCENTTLLQCAYAVGYRFFHDTTLCVLGHCEVSKFEYHLLNRLSS